MKIEVKIDETCPHPKVVIYTDHITDEVNSIVKRLSEESPQLLAGFREDRLEILRQPEIVRIFASGGKVYAQTRKGEYILRLRLYELEDRLDRKLFVRISNSEIINLTLTEGFDLSLTGTIRVALAGGIITYVSRRYVSKIKQVLGI